jgi:acyl-CoA synthetase (AMP-forming)/AMP-acid ligase II
MTKTNISEYLPEVAEKYVDKTAITFRNSKISFQELNELSNFYACEFRKKGIQKGTKTLVMLRPGIEFIAVVFALFKAGAIPVLIDPGMGVKNLLNCIKKTKPEAMIGIAKAQWVRMLFPQYFRSVKTFISSGTGSPFWITKIPDFTSLSLSSGKYQFEIELTSLDDTAAIVFTTGSTGPPKGVVYTHRIYITQTEIIGKVYDAGPDQIDMPAFPLFALFSSALGMPCVIPDINPSLPAKVDPKVIIDTITKHNVSFSFASPALWGRVCAYCIKNKIKLPTLKKVLMAGAPVNPLLHTVLKKIISEDGDTFVPYGATESLPIANMCGSEFNDSIKSDISKGKGYCVGKPLPGISIKIIKPSDDVIEKWDNSLSLPDGEIGEIVVDGNVVTPEYHNLPEYTAMAKIKKSDGTVMHRMGDIGFYDKNGYLWFKGRKAHRVLTKNEILYPVCCEAIFNAHKKVFRSALVGVGPEGDKTPVMIIQPVPGIIPIYGENREKFIEELKELGAKEKHTAGISEFLFTADFPVDIRHNAKIFREKLTIWAEKITQIKKSN